VCFSHDSARVGLYRELSKYLCVSSRFKITGMQVQVSVRIKSSACISTTWPVSKAVMYLHSLAWLARTQSSVDMWKCCHVLRALRVSACQCMNLPKT
jgi:hypothetical protein